jgi:hypothetical protein
MNETHHEEVKVEKTTTVSETQKISAIKTLAIVGFVATIIILVWLAVMVVRFIPDAFSTLASMAQSVSTPSRELSIESEKTIAGSGETFTITWTKTRRAGTYGLSYGCVDGVAATLHTDAGATPFMCDTWIPLPEGGESAGISFTSEKGRFADVPLNIRFIAEDGNETGKNVTVTIVNATFAENTGNETPVKPTTPAATTTPATPVKPTEPTKPVVTTPTRPVVSQVPVSNPNGFTDLSVAYVGVGSYNAATGVFSAKTTLDNDDRAALRFVVTNIGTKTSSAWSYKATVPTSGTDTYRSNSQAPLIPGERAIVTVLFGDIREKTGTANVEVEVSGGNDTKTGNNDFEKSVKITD